MIAGKMVTLRNKYYLLNFVFLSCLIIILLNDHIWKYEFSNWLTSKLSDAAGVILLPLLIAFIFPGAGVHAIWVTALLFTFWKSPFSQPAIDFYNRFAFIETSRVIDYTDLFVLVLLPVPYFIIERIDGLNFLKVSGLHPLLVLLPSVLALMATSPPYSYYLNRSEGNLRCSGCKITVRYNQDEIVERLKKRNIVFDSIAPIGLEMKGRLAYLADDNVTVYRLNRLIIDEDTLRNLDFTMRTEKEGKTKIYFTGMQVSEDISTPKLQGKLLRYYRRTLFKELRNILK